MFLPPCWHFLAPQAVNIWRSQRNANILANAKVFFQQAECSTYTKQRHKHIRYFHLKWPKGCHHNLHSGEVQSMGGQQGSFSYSCLCQHSCQSKQLTNFKPYQHPKGGVHKGRGGTVCCQHCRHVQCIQQSASLRTEYIQCTEDFIFQHPMSQYQLWW